MVFVLIALAYHSFIDKHVFVGVEEDIISRIFLEIVKNVLPINSFGYYIKGVFVSMV